MNKPQWGICNHWGAGPHAMNYRDPEIRSICGRKVSQPHSTCLDDQNAPYINLTHKLHSHDLLVFRMNDALIPSSWTKLAHSPANIARYVLSYLRILIFLPSPQSLPRTFRGMTPAETLVTSGLELSDIEGEERILVRYWTLSPPYTAYFDFVGLGVVGRSKPHLSAHKSIRPSAYLQPGAASPPHNIKIRTSFTMHRSPLLYSLLAAALAQTTTASTDTESASTGTKYVNHNSGSAWYVLSKPLACFCNILCTRANLTG